MGESETKKVHEIDGYLVETDSSVRLLTGPVVGEVGAFKILCHLASVYKESSCS